MPPRRKQKRRIWRYLKRVSLQIEKAFVHLKTESYLLMKLSANLEQAEASEENHLKFLLVLDLCGFPRPILFEEVSGMPTARNFVGVHCRKRDGSKIHRARGQANQMRCSMHQAEIGLWPDIE